MSLHYCLSLLYTSVMVLVRTDKEQSKWSTHNFINAQCGPKGQTRSSKALVIGRWSSLMGVSTLRQWAESPQPNARSAVTWRGKFSEGIASRERSPYRKYGTHTTGYWRPDHEALKSFSSICWPCHYSPLPGFDFLGRFNCMSSCCRYCWRPFLGVSIPCRCCCDCPDSS